MPRKKSRHGQVMGSTSSQSAHEMAGWGHAPMASGHARGLAENGRKMDTKGYVWVQIGTVWIPEHRWVAACELKRALAREEVVHHLNGIKHDNRPENLEVLTPTEHASLHHAPGAPGAKWSDAARARHLLRRIDAYLETET